MDSSKYDSETRKQFKRDQRTAAYRDLQRRSLEARTQLEATIRSRNETIDRMAAHLLKMHVAPEEVAKLRGSSAGD